MEINVLYCIILYCIVLFMNKATAHVRETLGQGIYL
jgi:hypothetical protein